MNRRALLRAGATAAAAILLGGHTPYGQWVVYRKKHLLIGCHKEDPRTYVLAKEAVALLEPKIVIPINYQTDAERAKLDPLDRFLKEMGEKDPEHHAKVTITRSSLPEETQVLVVDYKR